MSTTASAVFAPNPHALGTITDFQSQKFFTKSFLFQLINPNLASSYSDSKTKQPTKAFPASFGLKMEVEVFDKDAAIPRRRVMRLVKNESSLWTDEQSKDEKVPKAITYLDFIDGKRLIPGDETLLIKFLMADDRNASKPGRNPKVNAIYELVDLAKGLEAEIIKDMRITELKQWCYLGPWHEVAAYARVLNRPVDRDPNQVRADMVRHAVADPERFFLGMKNELALRKHYVITAVETGVLEHDPSSNSLQWGGSGTRLITAPMGSPAIDFYVDHTQTPAGKESYEHLLSKLNLDPKANKLDINAKTPEKEIKIDPSLNATELTPALANDLLAVALEKGVIIKYGRSTYSFDHKGPDEKNFIGPKQVTVALVQDSEFLKRVQAKIRSLS